ncbi:MAG: hypothetical protein LPK07_06570 [Hymenobacteraceae bacterium]|nr:hypothetical protein [Hymenobacteraceae bacterium]
MKNKDNFRTRKDDGDKLGEQADKEKLSKTPSPKGTNPDRESETTPPENEVYVDLEPDELHLSDEEPEEVKSPEEKKKKK